MKLKTLGDIEGKCGILFDKNLRQEAVKWYKHFEEAREDVLGIKQYEVADKLEGLMGFIIKFFNITESDLKESKGGKE